MPPQPRSKSLLTPWMNATLVDFYFNVFALWCIIVLREPSLPAALFWCLFVGVFGSIGSWLYVLKASLAVRPGDTVAKFVMGASA